MPKGHCKYSGTQKVEIIERICSEQLSFHEASREYDIDGERKTEGNNTIKTDKLNTGYECKRYELNVTLRKESFASRCETLLLHDRKSYMIKSIIVA